MRAVYFTGEYDIEIRDIPVPSPQKGEVLLEMKASGICGSDLSILSATKPNDNTTKDLIIPGHEPVGIIRELGSNVQGLAVGDRVMMHHYSGCLNCSMCKIGFTQMCLVHHEVYGRTMNGGHEDYMIVPEYTCIPMPEELDFASAAACACGTGTAFQALKRLSIPTDSILAVFGQGPVGLSATMFASQMNVKVIAIDVVKERLELAKELGAWETINSKETDAEERIRELTNGEGSDFALDATGIPEVRVQAVDSTKYWGTVCFVGEGNTTTFDISKQIIHKQLSVIGSWTFSQSGLSNVANFVVDKKSPMAKLITHTFELKDAEQAYEKFVIGNTGKVIFTW